MDFEFDDLSGLQRVQRRTAWHLDTLRERRHVPGAIWHSRAWLEQLQERQAVVGDSHGLRAAVRQPKPVRMCF